MLRLLVISLLCILSNTVCGQKNVKITSQNQSFTDSTKQASQRQKDSAMSELNNKKQDLLDSSKNKLKFKKKDAGKRFNVVKDEKKKKLTDKKIPIKHE